MIVPPQALPWIYGIVGAFVGSFLNVCILRMPKHRSIVWPGSACPSCGSPIAPWHNLPIVSYLLLRGRCAACGRTISARYPFVEGLSSALWVAAWLRFGGGVALVEALILVSALIVLFFTDLDERILPDLVTLPVAGAGLLLSFFRDPAGSFASGGTASVSVRSFLVALATAFAGAASFWLLGRLWRLVRPEIESAIGLGDVKLMAMLGAFLDWRLILLTVFLGSLLGTVVFLLSKVLGSVLPADAVSAPAPLRPIVRSLEAAGFLVAGRGAGLLDLIPFGSLLAVGAVVSLFFGDRLVSLYMAFAGLPVS